MSTLLRKGELPPIGADLENKPRNGRGFLLIRPFTGEEMRR